MDADKYNMPSSPTSAPTSTPEEQPECDYDANPTVLYQAIAAKQWDYAVSLFAKQKQEKQSSTWVVRKETNGKLRWRLLPLHAAVIFGSPLRLVELLLTDYPAAAQSKDDQGMLPLHLAFRNEGDCSWEITEELLTAYPQAIFVSDRKGRTPLQCGLQVVGSSANSIGSTPAQSRSFKSIVSVLELYSQIVVSGDRTKTQVETTKHVESRIKQVQDSHLQTLSVLKQEWNTQHQDYKEMLATLEREKSELQEQILTQEVTLDLVKGSEAGLQEKLRQKTAALKEMKSVTASPQDKMANDVLRAMVEDMVVQQKDYHLQFSQLAIKYENLVQERQHLLDLFLKKSSQQNQKETDVVKDLKKWLHEKEKKLKKQEACLDEDEEEPDEEEKKIEDALDFVERSTETAPKMTPRAKAPPSSKLDVTNVIDLSQVASDI